MRWTPVSGTHAFLARGKSSTVPAQQHPAQGAHLLAWWKSGGETPGDPGDLQPLAHGQAARGGALPGPSQPEPPLPCLLLPPAVVTQTPVYVTVT